MDVVLGVAVTGRVARLALVGASDAQVYDQYALDLPDDALTDLGDTIVGTYRAVADSGNRVAATRLCLPDAAQAETLRQAVLDAGVQNVEVISEAEAAAALARGTGADAALLVADDDTVSLTVVGEDEESTSALVSVPIGAAGAAVACAEVLRQVPDEGVMRIVLVGQRLDLDSVAAELSSTTPVELPPDAGFGIARGAAQTAQESGFPAGAATQMAPAAGEATQMAPAAGDATQMAPVAGDATQMAPAPDPAAVGPQLAYSQEEPGEYELPFESLEEYVPELEDEEAYTSMIPPPPPRTLLMGSALGFVVVSFAALAASVAIAVRPVADVSAQPPPPAQAQAETVPGRYLPTVPHEPDPVALPVAVVSPAPEAPRGTGVLMNRGPNRVVPQVPAPQVPAPAPAPVPNVPVVPVVPVPRPFNPFPTLPTWTTTVTTSVTPTTTATTPTTTSTEPTTTETTTSEQPTTSEEPTTETTTSEAPTTSEQTPTSEAPIEYSPVTPAPEPPTTQVVPAYTPPPAVAPAPAPAPVAPTPAPVVPELPSSGGGYGSGSDSGSGGSVQAPATTVMESP